MRTRTLRTTVLLAVLVLTPALASARPWSDSGDVRTGVEAEQAAPVGFWESIADRLIAFWAPDGGRIVGGGTPELPLTPEAPTEVSPTDEAP